MEAYDESSATLQSTAKLATQADWVVCIQALKANPEDEYKVFTTRQLLKELKDKLAPSDTSIAMSAWRAYKAVLLEAYNSGVNPRKWFARWSEAYSQAFQHRIPEIEGTIGKIDFLEAVGARCTPSWAYVTQDNLSILESNGDSNIPTLPEYASNFRTILENYIPTKKKYIYSTLAGRSNNQNSKRQNNSNA
ncbi:uncharacterized protein TrAFT101_010475 [Trichoderma asperellum]|uniref:Uncharacterized protein n=1 Tax=Trichoderma asperellum (strain ATCC 204424 / CBS 433.97 / NBRC 101777) TaxID=1042311 RepID=A0A2T3YVJ9_TRIA4|nr:hypothetical protein M441DRAFT_449434 [Trichoderma asperellum CBS 433.97]PTB36593.1 hypothetical protein M441DRAFT_449434 [Trichoderma asperellum CBS 433.97]UKZ95650.1 hypothetical protein TrAFT101_010475 [Trichoderma asperellum]